MLKEKNQIREELVIKPYAQREIQSQESTVVTPQVHWEEKNVEQIRYVPFVRREEHQQVNTTQVF